MSRFQGPSFQPVHHGSPSLSYSAFKANSSRMRQPRAVEQLNKWRFWTDNKARDSLKASSQRFHPMSLELQLLQPFTTLSPLVQVSMLPYFNCIMSSNTVITAHCSASSKSESAPGASEKAQRNGAASVASFATWRGDAKCRCN